MPSDNNVEAKKVSTWLHTVTFQITLMIFEQAFIALPEFLVGAGFTRYDAEGTLVMAYAMSVLQELNGRNVNNPISLISGEKRYPNYTNRSVDLHLEYDRIGTLSTRLQAFGVRQQSWLEAKFFRKKDGKPTLPTTSGAYALLRDILRLAVFPVETVGESPISNRFLLHVYEGPHFDHLALDRNPPGGGTREQRSWLSGLHDAGSKTLVINDLDREPPGFGKEVGKPLALIECKVDITNFVLAGTSAPYSLYLTRIDSFKIKLNSHEIKLSPAAVTENTPGDWKSLGMDVDAGLAK